MIFTQKENTPILINLVQQARDTGWTLPDGVNAFHNCNPGNLILTEYPIFGGNTYQVSYVILSIAGGNLQVQVPGANGVVRTTTGLYVEQISPTSNGFISFYSNATCEITAFNVNLVSSNPGITIVYSAINSAKRGIPVWSDFRTFYPDFGFSLYTRTIVANNGAIYELDGENTTSTNNFFGTPFQSSIRFVEAKNPGIIKDFEALSYQANQLLTSTIDGIQTSLGQITTLIDTDFIKQFLVDDDLEVVLYQNDNVYSASFLGDENGAGTVNGDGMRGNFIIVELVTVDGSTPLTLYSIGIRVKPVFIGARP